MNDFILPEGTPEEYTLTPETSVSSTLNFKGSSIGLMYSQKDIDITVKIHMKYFR